MKTYFHIQSPCFGRILLLGLCLFLSGFWTPIQAQPIQAPRFRLSNLEGTPFYSTKAKGQVIVVSFFFTRCPPCIKEMPELYQFMQRKGLLRNLLFVDSYVEGLGIQDAPDTEKDIRLFVQTLGIPEANTYHDRMGAMTKNFANLELFPQAKKSETLLVFPTIVIIDRQGQVAYVQEGSDTKIFEILERLL
ncbi:MAG: TlpA family protein disulfide reductase [SAR324 cluster bacterium]|nr:TlpA family protein disulfide reductase [SAR324 cluster bacterium]MBF0349958.1 TlpA family protein disulfide reductase [SAR324 cluster bacterium]